MHVDNLGGTAHEGSVLFDYRAAGSICFQEVAVTQRLDFRIVR